MKIKIIMKATTTTTIKNNGKIESFIRKVKGREKMVKYNPLFTK